MNFKVLSLFVSFALLVSCSRQSDRVVTVTNEVKVPVEATHVEALVAADAGASLSIGNKIQLTVPAGALSEDANISVTKGAVVAPKENLVPISTSLEMGGHGIEFNKPVALNVCYDASALVSQNLKEETVQVYYVDPLTGEYAAVGGNVNLAAHCVSAQLTHFSTYLIAAQILQGGNNAPVISAPTFTPTVPMAGLPLKISSVVTDYELTAVNGQIGFGQVATATLYYRIPGEPSFTQVALTPDTLDDTATRYSYKIPANRVTTTGIEYYLKATDNLGANRIRNTVTLPIARTATGIAFQTTVAVDLAAGFKRSYTLRGIDDLGAQRNIEVDSFAVNNGIGTAAKISASVVQFTATTANAQNYRIGSISATAGSFNTTSPDIRVHAGYLDHIALLSPTGVVLGNSITVNANSIYDFDVLGYDAYGNTTNILPQFVIVPVSGAGTISPTGLYTAPATAQTATLVATLDGVMDSILINVVPAIPSPQVASLLGGSDNVFIGDLAYDGSGNYYVSGTTSGNFDGLTKTGAQDLFLVKFNADGVKQWALLNGVSGVNTNGMGVATDNAGNVYVTGTTNGYLNGEPNPMGLALFIVKYNASGVRQWTRLMTDPAAYSSGFKSCSDSSGVYVTGQAIGSFDGQPQVGLQDFLITKYDFSGNRIWSRILGGSGPTQSQGFGCTVAQTGSVYVTGQSVGGSAFDGNPTLSFTANGVLVKFDSSGNKIWSRIISSGTVSAVSTNVATDAAENLYVTGVLIGSSMDDQTLADSGYWNGFLVKYDSSGSRIWTRLTGASVVGTTGGTFASDVSLDTVGNVYVTGVTNGNIDGLVNPGNSQYLQKYTDSGVRTWTVLSGSSQAAPRGDGIHFNSSNGRVYTTGSVAGAAGALFGGQPLNGYAQLHFTIFQ